MGKFDGRVVIVTGSSAGIGKDAAIEFGKEGASLVIHGKRNEEHLNETANALQSFGVPNERILKVIGSMTDSEAPKMIIEKTIEKYGRIDVLINNAGALVKPNFLSKQHELENLDFLYHLNVRSVIELTQLALPYLEKTKGNVINVSSTSGEKIWASSTFYCVSKAAINQFTRCYAQKYGPKGVRINAIAPGPIGNTYIVKRQNDIAERENKLQTMASWGAENTVMKRGGTVSETSAALKFLASDEASYITGAILPVDGGAMVDTADFQL